MPSSDRHPPRPAAPTSETETLLRREYAQMERMWQQRIETLKSLVDQMANVASLLRREYEQRVQEESARKSDELRDDVEVLTLALSRLVETLTDFAVDGMQNTYSRNILEAIQDAKDLLHEGEDPVVQHELH